MDLSATRERADTIFNADLDSVHVKTDRVFVWLLMVQWAAAVVLAVVISPYAWIGRVRTVHLHVEIAVLGGLIINSLPIALIYLRPGAAGTRHVVAASQMLWAAIFVHLTGGRIETHFHIFGSLAFLSFYRDPRVLVTATAVVALDHLLLGFYWPESVYGIANPEWWRFAEHATWVIFEDIVLWQGCRRALAEMHISSAREATLESTIRSVEQQVTARTEELKTAANRYRNLLENTSAIPWEVDRNTLEILYAAPQLSALLGPDAGPVPQTRLLDCFHPDDRDTFRRFVGQGSDAAPHIDSRVIRGNQTLHLRSFVSATQSENRSGVYGISIDVTQQKKLEQDLVQAKKLESIGQLSAGIAHEINTPTQFIGDNVRFLDDSMRDVFTMLRSLETRAGIESLRAPEVAKLFTEADIEYLRGEVPKAISQTLEGVTRISKIVGAMKEFSHPAAERTPHDLNRAIASTITVASHEWKYLADLETDFDQDLPFVTVMPGAFNQVILNILVNAAHAIAESNKDTPDARGLITVSTRKIGQWAETRIQDSGIGIPERIRDRVFDPFFTTKPVGKGTGQGLAIAHDVIVNKHGGTIQIDTTPGVGTTFVIRIPISPGATAAAAAA